MFVHMFTSQVFLVLLQQVASRCIVRNLCVSWSRRHPRSAIALKGLNEFLSLGLYLPSWLCPSLLYYFLSFITHSSTSSLANLAHRFVAPHQRTMPPIHPRHLSTNDTIGLATLVIGFLVSALSLAFAIATWRLHRLSHRRERERESSLYSTSPRSDLRLQRLERPKKSFLRWHLDDADGLSLVMCLE